MILTMLYHCCVNGIWFAFGCEYSGLILFLHIGLTKWCVSVRTCDVEVMVCQCEDL